MGGTVAAAYKKDITKAEKLYTVADARVKGHHQLGDALKRLAEMQCLLRRHKAGEVVNSSTRGECKASTSKKEFGIKHHPLPARVTWELPKFDKLAASADTSGWLTACRTTETADQAANCTVIATPEVPKCTPAAPAAGHEQ